jgi:hypothetical protein
MSELRLSTGHVIDVVRLRPEQVRLWDIAWSLDKINRYLGHTPVAWSVLSHTGLCYILAMIETKNQLPKIDQIALLLHDAAEAYIGDMPRPIKETDHAHFFVELEQRVLSAILARFGIKYDQVNWNVVKRYDNQALHVEMATFYPDLPKTFAPPEVYHLDNLPRLTVGKPQDYVALMRELAINLGGVERINEELCYFPDFLKPYVDSPAPVVEEHPEQSRISTVGHEVLHLRVD